MTYSVDVNFNYQKIKAKMLRRSLLFSLIFALTIIADILLVILAKEDYLINLIISIIITTLFIFFAIFYISNIFSDMNNEYRYYRGYESGIKNTDEVIMIKGSDELTYMNGLYVYPILVKYVNGLSSQDKIIFSLKKDLGFLEGDKLTITTYQRIILAAEKHL